MLTKLNHGDYAEQINTKFRVVETAEPMEIELAEISELKRLGAQEIFSLIFTGDKNFFLPQRLYELEHETLGRDSLFLVPVGEEGDRIKYESVFNRLKKSE
ncbi:hypothetical protein BH20ACI4_BH20ACI4_07390 [soil metagenome]